MYKCCLRSFPVISCFLKVLEQNIFKNDYNNNVILYMKLFEKGTNFGKKLFSKYNGEVLLRKGRDVLDTISNNSNLISMAVPVALALGQPEIALGLTAISKYAPKVKDAVNSIQKKKPEKEDKTDIFL